MRAMSAEMVETETRIRSPMQIVVTCFPAGTREQDRDRNHAWQWASRFATTLVSTSISVIAAL